MYQSLLTGGVLAVCSYTDIRYRKIYSWITGIYLLLALLGHLASGALSPLGLAAGLVPGGVCFLVSWATRQGLGYGDSILIAICGISLGFWPCTLISFTAFFWSGIWAMILLCFRKAGRKKEIPFVPFLFLGMVLQRLGGW